MTTDSKISRNRKSKYPGIAKLVSRLVWEREAQVRAAALGKPRNPWDTWADSTSPIAGNWSKIGVDHMFDHNWKISYPGVAQLVARLLWEREAGVRAALRQKPGKLWDAKADGILPFAGNWSKTGVDPIFDHSWKIPYPGVAQLVARLLWENTPGPPHNFISGCSAAGSAPALGAGCRRFESCHSDHLS